MRTIIITILFGIALMLLMAESDDVAVLLETKVGAFVIGYLAVRLSDKWTLSNLINDKED